ncbi:MAG: hypothetical protein OEL76_11850 [Siculibacillus sp.]|nr:hypothetical protein [Siculibacillus sp.]
MTSTSAKREELVDSILGRRGFRKTHVVDKVIEYKNSDGVVLYYNRKLSGESVGIAFNPVFEKKLGGVNAARYRNDDMLNFDKVPGRGRRPTRLGIQVKLPNTGMLDDLLNIAGL